MSPVLVFSSNHRVFIDDQVSTRNTYFFVVNESNCLIHDDDDVCLWNAEVSREENYESGTLRLCHFIFRYGETTPTG